MYIATVMPVVVFFSLSQGDPGADGDDGPDGTPGPKVYRKGQKIIPVCS